MEDEREEEEEVMFLNIVQGETVDSEEEGMEDGEEVEGEMSDKGAVQAETTTSDEELEEKIERTRTAVDECYRQRSKRVGINIEGTEGRLLTEEELDSLSEQLGDGEGARAKRRREIEKMSIKEMEAEIKEVKGSLVGKKVKGTRSLLLVMTLLCLMSSPVKGFTAYDCTNRSNIVESYSLLEPDVCANMGKEGGGGDHGVRGDRSDQARQDDPRIQMYGH
jgi:hypothetical protein